MRTWCSQLAVVVGCVGLLPAAAFGQGAIGGAVRDTSGGVLPGVTVEAASPVLIERVRTATTDNSGQYLIVDLRPGIYSVTFTLTGFTSVKREGLALSTGVTLPINAELKVGAIEETIIVTGATPVVDVQNTRQQAVLTRELLDAIPRTRHQFNTTTLLPGIVQAGGLADVGGSNITPAGQLSIHGGRSDDQIMAIDGMKIQEGGAGARRAFAISDNVAQEYTVETSGLSAEFPTGGVRMNMVPKEGGNVFRGTLYGDFTTGAMVSDNLSADLKDRGLTSATRIRRIWDFSPAVGGPLLRDRLWFFTTYRHWGSQNYPPNAFYLYEPTRPALDKGVFWDANARVTWQATPRNKFSVFHMQQRWNIPHLGVTNLVPPEVVGNVTIRPAHLTQVKWNSPVTNRVLVEGAGYYFYQIHHFGISPGSRLTSWMPEPADPSAWPTFEITSGKWIGGSQVDSTLRPSTLQASWVGVSGALSYVTGSHNLKVGLTHVQGYWFSFYPTVPPILRMDNGVPFQVQLIAKPGEARPRVNHDLGLYAQDQWTLRRLTLNLGVRFDYFNGQVDPQIAPASRWYVAERRFDKIPNVPDWKDISPRFGVAYNVFGDGKTAVKTNLSRYIVSESTNFQGLANPMGGGFVGGATDTRTWRDLNGDSKPQDDELGPSTNLNYGLPVFGQRPAEDLREGWGKRGYNWEYTASIQQQLLPGLSLSAAYFRRWFDNLTWTDNLLVNESDYTPLTLTSPLNGEPITLYNLIPAKRGLVDNLITFAPQNTQGFSGIDISVSGRFGRGGLVNGGVSMGRTVTDSCTFDDPNTRRFCKVTLPFMAENQYKFMVAYPFPYGLQVSGTFQSIPGPLISANYTVSSAIAGVPLTLGSLAVNLVEPGTLYGDRSNRVDVRFGRNLRIRTARLQPFVDLLNVFNASPVLVLNNTYGPAWQRPLRVLVGRMVKVGMQVDF